MNGLAKLPWKKRLIHYGRPITKLLLKLSVPFFAIRGKYPPLMLTPDDQVSPFGSGTTPTASREPSQMKIYEKFGRYIGDVVWLGWRNSGYGIAYYLKPDWLKDHKIKYEDLTIWKDGNRFYLKQPDGTLLWETQRKLGPFILLTGYRIEPIYNGHIENIKRREEGLERAPRPGFHPNMDGRPIVSLRTKRTM